MKPSNQCLRTLDAVRLDVVHRLQKDRKLIVSQRRLHVAHDHLILQHQLAHAVVVIRIANHVIAFDLLERHARPIAHLINRQLHVFDGIHPGVKHDVVADVERANRAVKPVNHSADIDLVLRNADDEVIRLHSTAYAKLRIDVAQKIIRRSLQNQIACLGVKQIVYRLETTDVEVDDEILSIRVGFHHLRRALVKRLASVEPRQKIPLEMLIVIKNLLIQLQLHETPLRLEFFNRVANSFASNCLVVRSIDKFRRAMFQCPGSVFQCRHQREHRNLRKVIVRVQPQHELPSARHF